MKILCTLYLPQVNEVGIFFVAKYTSLKFNIIFCFLYLLEMSPVAEIYAWGGGEWG